MGDKGEGAPHREERKKLSSKEIKIFRPGTKTDWPTDTSSRQRGKERKKENNCDSMKCNI
jgi:hypothetical protein